MQQIRICDIKGDHAAASPSSCWEYLQSTAGPLAKVPKHIKFKLEPDQPTSRFQRQNSQYAHFHLANQFHQ